LFQPSNLITTNQINENEYERVPKGVCIRGHRKRQLIIFAAGFQTSHDFWSEVAQPTWRDTQSITPPKKQMKSICYSSKSPARARILSRIITIRNRFIPVDLAQFRNAEQAEVSDDHFAILQKDVLGFQVLVNNTSGMQVPHSLNTLTNQLQTHHNIQT